MSRHTGTGWSSSSGWEGFLHPCFRRDPSAGLGVSEPPRLWGPWGQHRVVPAPPSHLRLLKAGITPRLLRGTRGRERSSPGPGGGRASPEPPRAPSPGAAAPASAAPRCSSPGSPHSSSAQTGEGHRVREGAQRAGLGGTQGGAPGAGKWDREWDREWLRWEQGVTDTDKIPPAPRCGLMGTPAVPPNIAWAATRALGSARASPAMGAAAGRSGAVCSPS